MNSFNPLLMRQGYAPMGAVTTGQQPSGAVMGGRGDGGGLGPNAFAARSAWLANHGMQTGGNAPAYPAPGMPTGGALPPQGYDAGGINPHGMYTGGGLPPQPQAGMPMGGGLPPMRLAQTGGQRMGQRFPNRLGGYIA